MIDLYIEIQDAIGWAIITFIVGLFYPLIAKFIDQNLIVMGIIAFVFLVSDIVTDFEILQSYEIYESVYVSFVTLLVIAVGEAFGMATSLGLIQLYQIFKSALNLD